MMQYFFSVSRPVNAGQYNALPPFCNSSDEICDLNTYITKIKPQSVDICRYRNRNIDQTNFNKWLSALCCIGVTELTNVSRLKFHPVYTYTYIPTYLYFIVPWRESIVNNGKKTF